MLELYYQKFSGKPDATLNGWNDYIVELDKIAKSNPKPNPCPSAKTLAELKQMKDDYRNPIAHPRVDLTEGDARMLFNNGESLIICMAQDLAPFTATANSDATLLPLLGVTQPPQNSQPEDSAQNQPTSA